jgi:hypothetical protein
MEEATVEAAIAAAGFRVHRRERIALGGLVPVLYALVKDGSARR